MGINEQLEEREVLDSIFPDEIQDVSKNAFRISIPLEIPKATEDEQEDPIIILNVRYTDAYPDEAPMLDISQPPNAPKHPQLDVQEDKAKLLESLQPTIDDNMGMIMIFALRETLKESAEQLIIERQQAVQAQKDAEMRKAEQEENRKFEGEKVTRITFLAWRENFRRDMAAEAARKIAEQEAEDKKRRGGKADEKKLSGKQLWEQGLAGKVIDEDEDGEDVVASMKHINVAG